MMMVSEAPKLSSAATALPLPTPEKGGATSFALLLSQGDIRQGSVTPQADGSAEQSTPLRQRKRGAGRDADSNGPEQSSSNGAKMGLGVSGLTVTTTAVVVSPMLDLPQTIGSAPVSLVDETRMDAVSANLPAGTQTPAPSVLSSQAPPVTGEGVVSGEKLPDDSRQIPRPAMSLDGNATLKIEPKGMSSIDLSDSATRGDGRPAADPPQEHPAGVNESRASVRAVGSNPEPPNQAAPINSPQPQDAGASIELANATLATIVPNVMIAQQPPASHNESPSLLSMEKTQKVTSNSKGAIPPTSSSPDQLSGKEGVSPAVEAIGGAAEGSMSSGHQGLPHGQGAPSSPERSSARGEDGLQSAAQPMDPAQLGAGRSISVESTHVGGNSLSSTSTSTQAAFQRVADFSAGRELQNALRGDLRVGVSTEVFGHVTIQTTSSAGQVAAQVSLEDARQGAVLAGHLPVVEQRLMQHLGVDASVRLAGGSSSAGGAWSGPGNGGRGGEASPEERRSPASGRQMGAIRPLSGTSGHKEEGSASSIYGSQMPSARLDLRV